MTEMLRYDAMAMLASAQLWPNLHGLIHWHKPEHGGPLRHVCICHTESPVSSEPARRLERFCNEYDPRIEVHLPATPCDLTPAGVRGQVTRWRAELPDSNWIINATGGNKLMFAGATEFASRPDTTVVYREVGDNAWFRLTFDNGALEARELTIAPEETDSIPVDKLIAAQWQPPPETRWEFTDPERLDVTRLVQAGIENDWAWKKAFAAAGYEQHASEKNGFLFERFIAAVLLEMGIENVRCNAKLRGATGTPLQEIDLIANHRGRLLVFDCKMRNREDHEKGKVEGITSQIRQAETTCRRLGGLGAQGVLIRPCVELGDDEQSLANAYRLQVIDLGHSRQLLRKLADFAGLRELPQKLQTCEELVDSHVRRTGDASAYCQTGYRAQARPLPKGNPLAMFDVDQRLKEHMGAMQQDWVAFFVDNSIYVRAANPRSLNETEIREALDAILQPHGSIDGKVHINQNARCGFSLKHKPKRRKHIEERLAKFLGKSLLGCNVHEITSP